MAKFELIINIMKHIKNKQKACATFQPSTITNLISQCIKNVDWLQVISLHSKITYSKNNGL